MRQAVEVTGEGPPVVLLHGFPLDRSMWAAQANALSDRFLVITPDLRGHGESSAPSGVYTMEELARDVLETVDSLGLEGPFVLGGLSMGGYVALALAELAPERVRGLILASTRAGADSEEGARGRESMAQSVESAGSVESVVEAMVPRVFAPGTIQSRPDLVRRWTERMGRTSVAGVTGALRGMAIRVDRREMLSRLSLPALVLAGEADPLITRAESEELARLSGGELVVIADAGHLAPIENPEATTSALRAFLESQA